jgi:hypothetical protein
MYSHLRTILHQRGLTCCCACMVPAELDSCTCGSSQATTTTSALSGTPTAAAYLDCGIRLLKLLRQLWSIVPSRHEETRPILFKFQVNPAFFDKWPHPTEADTGPHPSPLQG